MRGYTFAGNILEKAKLRAVTLPALPLRKPTPMTKPWPRPITLALGENGEDVAIDSTEAASWAMIEDWPTEEGPALDRALLICADVVNGKRKDDDARKAFLEAALEAGIAIRSR